MPRDSGAVDRRCGSWAMVGTCEHGHVYARELICGRDWCPHCGQEDSKAHLRRKASWFPRVVQAVSMVYLVLTVPPEIRGRYRTKASLGKLGTAAKRMMQRQGFKRGLRRWHWFGEQRGQELREYHPHLNLLVDGRWLPKEQLAALRESWARILGVDVSRVNLKARFCDTPRKILHRVKYITRATFLDWRWDEELARELVGFRNSSTWGRWDEPPAWDLPASEEGWRSGYRVAMLEHGVCPEDGSAIVWGGIVRRVGAPTWRHLGAGYWMQQRK